MTSTLNKRMAKLEQGTGASTELVEILGMTMTQAAFSAMMGKLSRRSALPVVPNPPHGFACSGRTNRETP